MEQVSRGFVYVWVARAARLQRRGFVPMVAWRMRCAMPQDWAALKPYKCDCGKRFGEQYQLDSHQWVCGKSAGVLQQVGLAFACGGVPLDSMCVALHPRSGPLPSRTSVGIATSSSEKSAGWRRTSRRVGSRWQCLSRCAMVLMLQRRFG